MQTETGSFLGERLKRWRKSKGLTLEQLAEGLGTSKGHLSDMERNKRPLSTRWLAKLTERYGAAESEIIIGSAPPTASELAEAQGLLEDLRDAGRLDEATNYLRYLAERSGSTKSPEPENPGPDRASRKGL